MDLESSTNLRGIHGGVEDHVSSSLHLGDALIDGLIRMETVGATISESVVSLTPQGKAILEDRTRDP